MKQISSIQTVVFFPPLGLIFTLYSVKKDELYSDGGMQIVRLKAYEIDLVSIAIVSWI